jgi:excisionase family DNA binding protein
MNCDRWNRVLLKGNSGSNNDGEQKRSHRRKHAICQILHRLHLFSQQTDDNGVPPKKGEVSMNIHRHTNDHEGVNLQPLLLTIPQVMECLALGRNKIYDLIQKEGLPVKRFGRSIRVPYAALEQWLEQRDHTS